MSTTNECLRGAGKAAFTVIANELRAKALIDRLGLSRSDNGRIATNDRPSNLLSKTNPDCTTKSKPLTTYFVAANAVLASVTAYLARLKFRPLDVVFLAGLICILRFWGAA